MTFHALPKTTKIRQEALSKLGIFSLEDCLLHFPLRHEDKETIRRIADGAGKSVRIRVTLLSVSRIRKRQTELQVECTDGSANLLLRFLKIFPGQYQKFSQLCEAGELVDIFGEIRVSRYGQLEMFHPQLMTDKSVANTGKLSPVYPICQGITQRYLVSLVDLAFEQCDLGDTLPDTILAQAGLIAWSEAIWQIHYQLIENSDQHQAWRRIRFDELLAQQLLLQSMRTQEKTEVAPVCHDVHQKVDTLMAALPFSLTAAQQTVWSEISDDLTKQTPMRRLLQGDVGSGKTVVAALAIAQAVSAGYQVAVMAPTDILANQHANTLSDWLHPVGIQSALITSSLDRKTLRQIKENLALGKIDCVIGTHALFYDSVVFDRLGLVIIDEQHRFGVEQRHRLCQKGKAPHQLLMTATPIPRTLAMTYLADADLSVIDEMPPNRKTVTTKLIQAGRRSQLIDSIAIACQQGQQVYWVCPLIEESDTLQLQTVETIAKEIGSKHPDLRIAVLTGRLKGDEKQTIMQSFTAGNLDVLIATTVIEVGVNVPTANIMVIESAERFGLAQLHQLRGRVGRGTEAASCILVYQEPLSDTARERLKILYDTNDGFLVAKKDMQLRGMGDYYGVRQSGLPLLRFADPLRDADLIELAASTAHRLIKEGSDQITRHLKRYHYFQDPQVKL